MMAPRGGPTDWSQVVALYDLQVRVDPSPMVALARAIALGELLGAAAGLAETETLAGALDRNEGFHAAMGRMLGMLGRVSEAQAAYDRAIELTNNEAEAAFLASRRYELGGSDER